MTIRSILLKSYMVTRFLLKTSIVIRLKRLKIFYTLNIFLKKKYENTTTILVFHGISSSISCQDSLQLQICLCGTLERDFRFIFCELAPKPIFKKHRAAAITSGILYSYDKCSGCGSDYWFTREGHAVDFFYWL